MRQQHAGGNCGVGFGAPFRDDVGQRLVKLEMPGGDRLQEERRNEEFRQRGQIENCVYINRTPERVGTRRAVRALEHQPPAMFYARNRSSELDAGGSAQYLIDSIEL